MLKFVHNYSQSFKLLFSHSPLLPTKTFTPQLTGVPVTHDKCATNFFHQSQRGDIRDCDDGASVHVLFATVHQALQQLHPPLCARCRRGW